MPHNTVEECWNILEDYYCVPKEVMECMTHIHGYTIETLEDVLYWKTGYNSFDQLDD